MEAARLQRTCLRIRRRWNGVAEAGDDGLPADAVARLQSGDLHLIDTFFSRALDLSVEKREELAARVASTVSGRMGVAKPEGMTPERMLEVVAYRMRGHGRF